MRTITLQITGADSDKLDRATLCEILYRGTEVYGLDAQYAVTAIDVDEPPMAKFSLQVTLGIEGHAMRVRADEAEGVARAALKEILLANIDRLDVLDVQVTGMDDAE